MTEPLASLRRRASVRTVQVGLAKRAPRDGLPRGFLYAPEAIDLSRACTRRCAHSQSDEKPRLVPLAGFFHPGVLAGFSSGTTRRRRRSLPHTSINSGAGGDSSKPKPTPARGARVVAKSYNTKFPRLCCPWATPCRHLVCAHTIRSTCNRREFARVSRRFSPVRSRLCAVSSRLRAGGFDPPCRKFFYVLR